MKKEEFILNLKNSALEENIILDEDQLLKLYKYKELLLEWNKVINLTAIIEEKDIIIKHFVDCLKITDYLNSKDKVIDVGTGAGFPGIIIATFYKDINITLVDSLNKRIKFLQIITKELELNNVEIIQARSEELSHNKKYREEYDVVVSRAVSYLNKLCELCIGYIKTKGKLIFMKGSNINQEIIDSKNCFSKLGIKQENIYEYVLNTDNKEKRNIVILNKLKKTDNNYPRMYSKIKNNPL